MRPRLILSAVAALAAFGLASAASAAPVEVRVFGAKSAGAVRLMIYADAESFLSDPVAKLQARINADGEAVFRLNDLPPGEYAFAAYHDENGDGVLNRNKIGLPKESFAFSNDVRPKFRRPSFERTKVMVDGPASVSVQLEKHID